MTWTDSTDSVPWEDGWYLVLVEIQNPELKNIKENGRTAPKVSKWVAGKGWIDDNGQFDRVLKWRQLPEH